MEVSNIVIPIKAKEIYATLFYLVESLILNEFEYENLENTDIFIDDIERALLYTGMCAITKNGGEIVALPCVTEKINYQGRPKTVTAYCYGLTNSNSEHTVTFKQVLPNLVVGKDCALIMNNAERVSNFVLIQPFLKRLNKIWVEHGENLKLSRAFGIIAGSEEYAKNFEKKYNELFEKGLAMFTVQDIEALTKAFQKFDLNIEYKQGEYHKDFDDTWQKMLTILGINNVGVEKRERLLVDEIGANNELLERIKNTKFVYRDYGIKQANKLYGLNIRIKERDTNVRKEKEQIRRINTKVEGEDK